MNSEDSQGRDRVRETIVSLMKSIGQAPTRPVAAEEVHKLRTAANRLDQMLKAAADADREGLKKAADRLDQLLADMQKGKDVTAELKRRRASNK